MQNKRLRFFFGIILLLIAYTLSARNLVDQSGDISSFDCRLYSSFQSGEMREWEKVMTEMKGIYSRKPSVDLLFTLTQTQYGYIGYLIGSKKSKEARILIAVAEKNIDTMLKHKPDWADAIALKAALVAYNISLSPYKAPILGPRSMNLIGEALTISKNSLQANIEKGNAFHYAPSMFGGDPVEATTFYTKAIALMEKQQAEKQICSWLYLNTLTQLALAYEKSNQTQMADATYRRILFIAPNFKWVREQLYPNFKRKHSK